MSQRGRSPCHRGCRLDRATDDEAGAPAAQQGDLAGLEALLAHDAVLTRDGGGKVPALARSLHGRNRVARTLLNWMRVASRLPGFTLRPSEVNGGPGAMVLDGQQRLIGVWSLEVAGDQIRSVSSVVNPEKLAHLGVVGDFASLVGELRPPRDTPVNSRSDRRHPGGTP